MLATLHGGAYAATDERSWLLSGALALSIGLYTKIVLGRA